MNAKPETRSIALDYDLPHPPAKVWRALTEPGLLAKWLMATDLRPPVGNRFTFKAAPTPWNRPPIMRAAGGRGNRLSGLLRDHPGRLEGFGRGRDPAPGLRVAQGVGLRPEGRRLKRASAVS